MPVFALADFGSTFTKVSVVEGDSGRLLATAQHPTTVGSDVMRGFGRARDAALRLAGIGRADHTLAASSAAGGLRMVAIGLVDDLTAAAAHNCALGAGAKVTGVFSGRLSEDEVTQIRAAAPDVVLFAGGTDGGDRARVLANARVTAQGMSGAAVVVACNQEIAQSVGRIFEDAGHETEVVANVLPDVHRQEPAAAREAIREVFIRRVVHAKGLSQAASFFEAILMPTPAAVLACAELLAAGTTQTPGTGSVVILDVGGATTDVHSVIPPPTEASNIHRARPTALAAARTVEGDLGMRWSAEAVLALDEPWLIEHSGATRAELRAAIAARHGNPALVAHDEPGRRIDRALAASCIFQAVARHVGRIATHYVPGEGAEVVVAGRDLREASVVLATGGSIAHDADGANDIVDGALQRLTASQPGPRAARVVIDQGYLAAAAGLLASVDPVAAARLLTDQYAALGVKRTTAETAVSTGLR